MKLSGFLNKPRWQAKEPAVRRAGVAEDDDAELLAGLAGIARGDPDPGVRSAALKRLADAGLTQRIAHEDADAGVRADARKLWFDLLAGTHARAPSATECERLLRAQDDAALIEHVARNAADPSLRLAALSRVTRVAMLAERATVDPAPDVRLAALERIDDESSLERLAERTRKTDKRVSRRARERADALRIARGDNTVAETLSRALCERMERLVREPQGADTESAIDAQWSAVQARAGDSLRARYRAARALLAASREAPSPAATPPVPTPDVGDIANTRADTLAAEPLADLEHADANIPDVSAAAVAAPDVDPLFARARFTASLSAANASKQQELAQQRQATTVAIESAVSDFEAAVDEGVVARAHTAHAQLAALRKSAGAAFPRVLQRRVTEAERRYAELSQWQHWSDNQRRRQLCETIEELAGSGLHPDAVATRVREAQTEWSKLDAAEGHAGGGHSPHGWARRFHAACRRALEPAKSYFRKRQELRKTHAQAISTSLEQAAAIPDDCSDWALIAKTRHTVVDALRTLDRIDPHERKSLAKKLKIALTELDARLAGHHAEVEGAKSALIAQAQALAAEDAGRGSAAAARALQQRWRDVGNGRRDRDQAQWRVFRGTLDAVFGKVDAERSQRASSDAESRMRADALCGELENLAKAQAPLQRSDIARIQGEWEALRVRDELLLRRFRAAEAALRDAGMRHERATRRSPYETWLARYKLCRAAEESAGAVEDWRAAWDASPRAEIASAALAARFEAALEQRGGDAASISADANEESLREVLIRLEIFAGVESPPEDHDRRRALQIERLSARMRGAAAGTPHQDLAELLTRWTELPATASVELDARLQRDLVAAIETLP